VKSLPTCRDKIEATQRQGGEGAVVGCGEEVGELRGGQRSAGSGGLDEFDEDPLAAERGLRGALGVDEGDVGGTEAPDSTPS